MERGAGMSRLTQSARLAIAAVVYTARTRLVFLTFFLLGIAILVVPLSDCLVIFSDLCSC